MGKGVTGNGLAPPSFASGWVGLVIGSSMVELSSFPNSFKIGSKMSQTFRIRDIRLGIRDDGLG